MIKFAILLVLTIFLAWCATDQIKQANKSGDGGIGTLILGIIAALAAIVTGGFTLWVAAARFLA